MITEEGLSFIGNMTKEKKYGFQTLSVQEVHELTTTIRAYKKELEFYADEKNHDDTEEYINIGDSPGKKMMVSKIDEDNGARARTVLGR